MSETNLTANDTPLNKMYGNKYEGLTRDVGDTGRSICFLRRDDLKTAVGGRGRIGPLGRRRSRGSLPVPSLVDPVPRVFLKTSCLLYCLFTDLSIVAS